MLDELLVVLILGLPLYFTFTAVPVIMRLAPILEYANGTNIVFCGKGCESRFDSERKIWGMSASYSRGKFLLPSEDSRRRPFLAGPRGPQGIPDGDNILPQVGEG